MRPASPISAKARLGRFHRLRHERNQGIMASLQDISQAVEGRAIFNQGADRQGKTADVLRMLPLTGQSEIIVGRRREKHENPT